MTDFCEYDKVIISSSLNNFAKETVGCCRFVSLLKPPNFLFLYGPFNDHVTGSDYTVANDTMITE
jgi:hypothetical protein